MILLSGGSEVPGLDDAKRPRGGLFHPSVPHVEDPHQARRQDVALWVSQVDAGI